MAKAKEKTYSASEFANKLGGIKKKFNDNVANISAEFRQSLPEGTYTVKVRPVTFRETNSAMMVSIPFTVHEGQYKGRGGSVTIFIDENRCFDSGELEGVPMGLVDLTRNAKNLGVDTVDARGKARDIGDVLEELEAICAEGPLATVDVSEYTYTVKKDGPNKGKEATGYRINYTGLVSLEEDEESTDEEEEQEVEEEEVEEEESEEEESDEEEESEEDPQPLFEVKEKVKFKQGRVTKNGTIVKVVTKDDEYFYNIKDSSGVLVKDVPEKNVYSL